MTHGVHGQTVIDCDIHNQIPGPKALYPYLSEFWRDIVEQTGFKGPTDDAYPPGLPTSIRPGSWPEGAGAPLRHLCPAGRDAGGRGARRRRERA